MIVDKYIVKDLGEKASDMFCESKVANLSAAVAAVLDEDVTKDQVDRVVQSTNQAAWRKLSARNGLMTRFDPASTGEVMKIVNPDEATKLASTATRVVSVPNHRFLESPTDRYAQFWDSTFGASDTEKTASYAPDGEENWYRIGSKIEQALIQLQTESGRAEFMFHTKLAEVREEVRSVLASGVEPEIVESGIRKAAEADPEIADLILTIAEPELSLGYRSKVAFELVAGSSLVVHDRLEDTDRLEFNPDHPLAKLATELVRLRQASAILEGAQEEGKTRLLHARQLAAIGDDPWAHPTPWRER